MISTEILIMYVLLDYLLNVFMAASSSIAVWLLLSTPIRVYLSFSASLRVVCAGEINPRTQIDSLDLLEKAME